jgi:hypothetical protein
MKMRCLLIFLVLFTMCKTDREIIRDVRAAAPLVIYKTKGDYVNNVPVIMNDNKDMIVAYPSPKDVYFNGVLALPDKLKHGYYVDNIGITKNSVFTSFTFDEYSKLETAPKLDDLMKSIIDNDPFLEIYDCGVKANLQKRNDLNKLIDSKFRNCKRLK